MRVSIMFRPEGEAPERAAEVAAALEDAGHVVTRFPDGEGSPGDANREADVVHAVGTEAGRAASTAAREAGAALVYDPLPGDAASGADATSLAQTAATGSRGGLVLARDADHAVRLRASFALPYLPPVVGDLDAQMDPGARPVLVAAYDRLPHVHPTLPSDGEAAGGRVRRWISELAEPVRRGGLRHPRALAAYLRGRRLRARGQLEPAIEALAQAADHDPEDPRYALYLAKALRESGDPGAASKQLGRLVGITAEPDLLGEAGVEFTRMGGRQRAEAIARGLAENAGGDGTRATAEAARVYAAIGDLDPARELALRASGRAGDGSEAQRTAARALEFAGEPSKALELARRAGEREQERRLSGLLRELEPGWTPGLSAEAQGARPRDAGVLVLLEVSLPQAPSGYAYRSRELMAALVEGGFDPFAATRLGFPASRGSPDWAPVESVDGVVHHRFNVPGMRQYSGVPLDLRVQENAERLLELTQRARPAAIIAGTPELNGVTALALRSATGTPVIYDVRGFPEMSWAAQSGGSNTELYRLRRAAETACASAADAVITLSETMKGELAGRGIEPERIFVVPQIVDAERFSPRPRDEALARSYGLEGRFVVGTVSSLTDYEGIDDLLRAVARARAESPEIAALIVGDGVFRPTLEELSAELGIEDAVVFTGRIEHERVADHYALLDVFAVPRRDLEVCRSVTPLKPFEALSMEIPVLATDLPALEEVVSASGGGRTVPPESADTLAEAILELAGDAPARERMGRSGRDHVLAHHTPERACEKLSLSLVDLVGKNRSTR